jgi:hypothetical protein
MLDEMEGLLLECQFYASPQSCFRLTLIRNAVKSTHVPSTFLFHVFWIGVHWKILIRKAEPYAPMIVTIVPQIATLVNLITGSLDIEHIAR